MFAYGELLSRRRVETVLSRIPESEPGWLVGYRRVFDEEVRFHTIVSSARERVEGILWTGLSDGDLERLDDYEGTVTGLYHRIRVRVHVDDGVVEAWAYAR